MELTQLGAKACPAEGTPRAVFVFAHGAGAGQHHPFMAGVSKAIAARGIDVVTFDFPYKRLQKSAPDRPPVLEKASSRARATLPYGLLYRIEGERIFVVAVAHVRRRPGYWRHREPA